MEHNNQIGHCKKGMLWESAVTIIVVVILLAFLILIVKTLAEKKGFLG